MNLPHKWQITETKNNSVIFIKTEGFYQNICIKMYNNLFKFQKLFQTKGFIKIYIAHSEKRLSTELTKHLEKKLSVI